MTDQLGRLTCPPQRLKFQLSPHFTIGLCPLYRCTNRATCGDTKATTRPSLFHAISARRRPAVYPAWSPSSAILTQWRSYPALNRARVWDVGQGRAWRLAWGFALLRQAWLRVASLGSATISVEPCSGQAVLYSSARHCLELQAGETGGFSARVGRRAVNVYSR